MSLTRHVAALGLAGAMVIAGVGLAAARPHHHYRYYSYRSYGHDGYRYSGFIPGGAANVGTSLSMIGADIPIVSGAEAYVPSYGYPGYGYYGPGEVYYGPGYGYSPY